MNNIEKNPLYQELLPTIYQNVIEGKTSITKIANEYGLNRNKIAKLLKEVYNYESSYAKFSKLANKKDFDKIDKEAFERYSNGENITTIAKDLGVKRQSLSKRLKEKYNLEVLQNGAKSINENFFKSKNDKSLYWLGYIYADGCITNNSLEICSKDKDSIENFKNDIESNHKIGEKELNNTKYYRINIHNQVILNDLKSFNVTQRKSFEEIKLPPLDDNEFIPFLRGFIDGDGCYYKKNNNRILTSITVGLVNYEFAKELKNRIEKIFNIKCTIYTCMTCYSICINKKNDNIKLIKTLYKNSTRHLNRKYEKIKDFI